MSATLDLASALIARPSITPQDEGCQAIIAKRLRALGFIVESINVGLVQNLWARFGDADPLFVFAGHTDVVPPGPRADWVSDPFLPEIRHGMLFGRGSADMKGSIAAMVTACERFFEAGKPPQGSIAFLITSDEEGAAIDGTVRVIEHLARLKQVIHYCIVGEPSSKKMLGDQIKNGRRGSLNGRLVVHGKQGHIAYPQLAKNPIHAGMLALAALVDTHWDEGNAFFPATGFQISNMHAGTGAENIIPGKLELQFNFRYSTETNQALLQSQVEAILKHHKLDYDLIWKLSGEPFLTANGALLDAICRSIKKQTGITTKLSTSGGTSDGRFIVKTGAEIIELGPVNATIHQANESVAVDDLDTLSKIYTDILLDLLTH